MRIMRGLFLSVIVLCAAGGNATFHVAGQSPPGSTAGLAIERLESLLGMKGSEKDGQYKVAVPQNDLAVSVDDFRIVPPMGLTSWVAFAPTGMGAVVMGDLVLLEDEIGPLEETLLAAGLTLSGLHNHFVRDTPGVMFMHIHGSGPQDELARGVRKALDKIGRLRREKSLTAHPAAVETTFDPTVIDQILGHKGEMNSGVYKVTVGRPDVTLMDHGARVTTFSGFNTWMAFQGTAEKAAVCGDFAMLEQEVGPVIEALVQNNIEVVAVHNHMLTEKPRIFFLHYWGVGSVETLAHGLKTALAKTGSP